MREIYSYNVEGVNFEACKLEDDARNWLSVYDGFDTYFFGYISDATVENFRDKLARGASLGDMFTAAEDLEQSGGIYFDGTVGF